MSQQVAEKAIKSFLYNQGRRELLGHSCFAFAKKCTTYSKDFSSIFDSCKKLDRFYTPARYPDSLPDGTPHDYFTDKDAKEALSIAEKVVRFIKKKL